MHVYTTYVCTVSTYIGVKMKKLATLAVFVYLLISGK